LLAVDAGGSAAVMYDIVDLLVARGWAFAADGHLQRARDMLQEAASVGEKSGDLVGALAALHGVARLGRARDVLEDVERLAGKVDGRLGPARLAHVAGLARADAAGLDDAASEFEHLGADLLAAEAAADAATMWRQQGQTRRSTAEASRAARLADRCEGATTLALRSIDSRALLTPAERETAELAAAGHSNKQIADELFLSVRSIENRLQRAYEKLGITSRQGLGEALGRQV
jgi:DNA-binding CsgD family transcriptional regulator